MGVDVDGGCLKHGCAPGRLAAGLCHARGVRGLVSGVASLWCVSALALTPAEVVTPELQVKRVTLAGLHDEEISYFDDDRQLVRARVGELARLRILHGDEGEPAGGAHEEAGGLAAIELVDGQRVVGAWQPPTHDGLLRVQGMLLPPVPLDAVRSVVFEDAPGDLMQLSEGGSGDTVLFRNGDRIGGLVTRVTDEALFVRSASQVEPAPVPWLQVRGVALVNPRVDVPARAGEHLLRLRDGSRVAVSGLSITSGAGGAMRVRFSGLRGVGAEPAAVGGESGGMPLREVEAIDFLGGGWRLVELAQLPLRVRDGGEVFGLAVPPRWEGEVLHLHAPVDVAFSLPRGAVRVGAVVELDREGIPTHLQDWATAVVSLGGERGVRLTAEQPRARLAAVVQAGEGGVALEVKVGEKGPILGRVRVTGGVVLVGTALEGAGSRSGGTR